MFLVAGVALAAAPPASNAPKYPSGANAPTTGAGTNAIGSTTPTVTGIALTSSPQSSFGFYRRNEDVEATVTFSEAVDITGTPQLELDFAGTAKAAACAAATNTTTMACSYRVAGGDSAPNGIAIKANKLTGGTITATGSTTAAVLDHAAVAIDADNKVDAIRPTLVTTGTDAPTTSTDGTTVILTFSEDIRPVNRNLITIQANGATLPTTAADRTGNKAEITLATALTATATNLTVSLASNAVFDVAGNGISFVAATAVTNAVVPPDPADPPDSLKARRGDGEVHLEWVPAAAVPTDPDLAYQLRYGVEGEEYNQWRDIAGSAPGGPNARSYTVTELENGTRYAFEVRVRRRGSGFGTAAEIRQTPEAARWSVSTNRRSVQEGEDVTLGIATSNAVGFYSAPEALTLAVIGQIEFRSTTIEGADPEDYEIRVDGTKVRGYTKDITFLNYDDDPDKDPFPAQHFDLEVPVGSTSLDVTVKVLADGEEEDQEHMTFMVFRGEEWVNGDTWGGTGVNIERSDAGVVKQLSVADAEATEGEDPSLEFVVTLAPAAAWTVTVDYATRDGTARAGSDYTDTSGSLTFAPGDTAKTVSVPVIDDTVQDTPETLTLRLSNADPPYDSRNVDWGSQEHGVLIADSVATGTIRNTEDQAEPRAVSVSDASAAEGDSAVFTVSLSAASSRQVTVDYATSGGTATSGTDFTAESGTLTFAANETSQTVSVATTDDSVDEENETFTLALSSPANATLGDATATGTIVDNDDELPPLTASICDRTAAVRDEILHLTGASDCSTVTGDELAAITTLELDNAGIDSLKSGDFAGLTELTELELYGNRLGTLPSDVFAGLSSLASLQLSYNNLESLAANVFSGLPSLVNLNVGHNALTSLPASVFSGLSNLKYLFLGANDIAALPAGVLSDLRSLDILFLEGNNFTTLPPGVFSDLASLRWLTLEGGALTTLPEDAFSGLSSLTTADLANNDLTTLPSNVFAGAPDLRELLLSGNNLDGLPDSVFLGLSSLRTLWLQGNNLDPMPVEVSLRTIGGGMVKATVSSGAPFPIEVPLTVTNGTVDGDSVIVIPAGSVESAAITVNPDPGADGAVTADVGTLPGLPVTSDYYSYWGETHPAHHGYELERSAADLPLTVHEIRTPSVASLVLSPVSIAEDGGVSTITATVSPAARTAFAVTVSAAAVSPGVAEDFTLSGNTLSVAAGATTSTGTVTITAVNNNVDAADKAVTVSGTIETEDAGVATPENRTLAIEDDDIASTPAVSVSDASAAEGDPVAFTVSLSAASSRQVTVDYATSGGTATSGTDFTAESGTLTFAANETSQTVSVATTDDSVDEENETFTLALSSPANATLGDATATGTIVDNDDELPPLTASFSDMAATHTGAGEFTFGLAFSEEVELSYVTLRDTAFVVTGGEVSQAQRQQQGSNQAWNITVEPDGQGAVTITLPETTDCDAADAICTGDERPLSHSLSSVVAGPVIIPAVSVSDASATEGDAVAFTVSLSAATSQQVTVEYATSGGTATSGTDFTAVSGTLTFAANETSKTVSVATTDDSVDEENETFTLTLSSPTNATLGEATATGTIRNTATATPLTASFEDVPATHDGSTEFAFKVRFSEAPAVSFRVLRDSAAFTVSAGTVKKALRVDGRDDLREIHIEPSGTGDITVTLVGGRACGTTGAICTSDGRPLSNSPSATITGPGTSSGSDGDGDDALLALVANVTPEAAAAALFGENALTDDQRAAMDQLGNRNGAYDLGDLLSWMARCRRNEASCGRTVSGTDAGSSASASGNAANETTGPNPAAEEGERPRRAALRPEHGRERGTRSTAATDALGCGATRFRWGWASRSPRDRLDPSTGCGSGCQRVGLRHRGDLVQPGLSPGSGPRRERALRPGSCGGAGRARRRLRLRASGCGHGTRPESSA